MKINIKNLTELRGPLTKPEKFMLEIIGFCLFILSWQILALHINKTGILPSPIIPIMTVNNMKSSVILSIHELWFQDLILKNTLYSLYLNFCGYLEALAISIPIGFLIGLSPIAKGLFNRPIDAIRFLPLTAVTGLFIAWFGIYTNMKILFLAFGITVYLIPVVIQRIFEVDEVYVQTIKTLGASKWQTIFKVFIPAVFSKLSDDIRILTAISWTYIIVAELLNNEGGIGSLTFRAARQGRLDKSFTALFVIILLGFAQDKLFTYLDKTMFKFKYTQLGDV